jgi:hypothetical protein
VARLSLPVLIAIFVAAAAVIWVAGIQLSDQTDVLSPRLDPGRRWAAWSCWRSRRTSRRS